MGNNKIENPRKNKLLLQVLRLVYKMMRAYIVAWAFYFIPISAVLVSLLMNDKVNANGH